MSAGRKEIRKKDLLGHIQPRRTYIRQISLCVFRFVSFILAIFLLFFVFLNGIITFLPFFCVGRSLFVGKTENFYGQSSLRQCNVIYEDKKRFLTPKADRPFHFVKQIKWFSF